MLVKEGVKTMKKKRGDENEMDCWNNKEKNISFNRLNKN
jgi:hypothetical protein